MLLLALTGEAGSGKDTMAKSLQNKIENVTCLAIAEPCKKMLAALLDVEVSKMEDREFKEAPHEILSGMTPRKAMQSLGTGWGRELNSEDFWVNMTVEKISQLKKRAPNSIIVVTDVRYDSEARALKKIGARIVRVIRSNNPDKTTSSDHSSEHGISDILVDEVFLNSATTKTQAQENFLNFLKQHKIINRGA